VKPPDEAPPPERDDEDRVLAERRQKLDRLRDAGVEPFALGFRDSAAIADVLSRYEKLEPGEEAQDSFRLAGRISARRGHGKAAFLDLVDRSGRIQLHARKDVLGDAYEGLVDLDLGDLIGVEGAPFRTRRGELSLRVDGWQLLAKSLRPPPDKYHGLTDVETRYRRRELDLLANEETRSLFIMRSRLVAAIRRFLDERGFLEVETPVLQPLYGGALARPFTTHYNALDRDFYLRIATELYLKRLIVGGLEKVYELGKDFRNEGISHKHNPEFTMLETYEAWADYEDVAAMTEELVAHAAEQTLGGTTVEREGETIDLSPPWRRITLREAIETEAGVDIEAAADRQALLAAMQQAGIDSDPEPGTGWGKLVDELLTKHVEP
jgi:lysyl-tRNA synthetase class 2